MEPPLYKSRSQAVIAQIKARFPNKPIRYVNVTHFHNDHGGGVRAYAAEGATVVVGQASRSHFEAILAAPHTVVPDALQNIPRQTEVLAVPSGGGLQLSGGGGRLFGAEPDPRGRHGCSLCPGGGAPVRERPSEPRRSNAQRRQHSAPPATDIHRLQPDGYDDRGRARNHSDHSVVNKGRGGYEKATSSGSRRLGNRTARAEGRGR